MKKYSISLLSLIFVVLIAASLDQAYAESDAAKKELVKKGIEVWNSGNAELANEVFSSDFTFNMVDHGTPVLKGVQGILDYSKFLRTAYPDMKYTPNWMVVDGDMVITQMSFSGTNTGPRAGAEPTGKTVTLSSILIAQIKDGKITEEWVYTNEAAIYRQLGINEIP